MLFKLDDRSDPGLARVKVLGKTRIVMGRQLCRIEVQETIKPGLRKVKVGQKLDVWEGLLISEASEA